MAQVDTIESDEAFARRLQNQELGILNPDSETTLMLNNNNRNPTVINARLNELGTARAAIIVIATVTFPQIIATIIVLHDHWNDEIICDKMHTDRWKWWSLISAVRMFFYVLLVILMHVFKTWLDSNQRINVKANNTKNIFEALALIWFVVGNMWLFGDDDSGCENPTRSPIYILCISMLIINYIQICLPCIIAVIMIPIFCFCMPCLIRILARLHDPRATQGATDTAINDIELITIDAETGGEDGISTCPICLNDMVVGEEARLLKCNHIFHKDCVDEWLRVNATCPTCRKSIIGDSISSDSNNMNRMEIVNNNNMNPNNQSLQVLEFSALNDRGSG